MTMGVQEDEIGYLVKGRSLQLALCTSAKLMNRIPSHWIYTVFHI